MEHHPHSAEWFRLHRPETYAFCQRIVQYIREGYRHISIKAPVKAGKREIVECLRVLLGEDYSLLYVTALNRKDVKNQRIELEKYKITTHVISSEDERGRCIARLNAIVESNKTPIHILDEDDHGSGWKQLLAPLNQFIENKTQIVKLYTSATPEELRNSSLAKRSDYIAVDFEPPKIYCGARYFLENKLVFKAHPFFNTKTSPITLSNHGRKVLEDSITPERNIACVRITGNMKAFKCSQSNITDELNTIECKGGRPWDVVCIDANSPFEWEKIETLRGYTGKPPVKNYLFLFLQTCTRSTDLKGWHPFIACWHDVRPANRSCYNTLVQAFLRPSHYSTMDGYNGPQRIRIYADERIFKAVVTGDMDKYLSDGGKAPLRTKMKNRGEPNQSDWTITWREVHLPDLVRENHTQDADGFYTMRTRSKKKQNKESYATFLQLQRDSETDKTWMGGGQLYTMEVGDTRDVTFISYKDIDDPSSIHIEVATITRTAVTKSEANTVNTTALSMYHNSESPLAVSEVSIPTTPNI